MIPLIKSMGEIGGINVTSLWWALSLGACLGGNGTLIGASANVVVSSLAAAHGRPISFVGYMNCLSSHDCIDFNFKYLYLCSVFTLIHVSLKIIKNLCLTLK